MELFAADRIITVGDAIPGGATSYLQDSDLLFHHPTAEIRSHSLDILGSPPPPPPQKLRPVRSNGRAAPEHSESPADPRTSQVLGNGGFSDALLDCQSIDFPELGFLSHQSLPTFGDGEPMIAECSDSVTDRSRESGGGGNSSGAAEIGAPPPHVELKPGEAEDSKGFLSENDSGSLSTDGGNSSAEIREHMNQKRRKRKNKMEQFLKRMMTKVIKKQEVMQRQLIEILEKRERERILREEAWTRQEMERTRRDEEVRTQERSRNLAFLSFVQKLLGHDIQIPHSLDASCTKDDIKCEINCESDLKCDPSNGRWSTSEVQALITLRTAMDGRFRGGGPRGPIWEELSAGLAGMGYSRTARQCKEKWENMNKYYKKSSTGEKRANSVEYFHELDILYQSGLFNSDNMPNSRNRTECGKSNQ